MPYLFAVLVILNALMLGYYGFLAPEKEPESLNAAKATLVQPIEFSNSAEHIPPLIGSKK